MCRIAGFRDFNYKGGYDLEAVTVSMRDTLTYGGPDDAGLYVEKERGLALGHRRLTILDLSELGHQPMATEDGRYWITYNGEVYNFQEVKEELIACGFKFRSICDTEVVLKAYVKWGMDAIHKFRGMFAFAIWDQNEAKLMLCRDRAGVKPLYWYYKDGLFMFASELKAFHQHPKFQKELDPQALSAFLQFGYVPAPYSILKNTYKLNPGHYLELNSKGEVKTRQYWNITESYLKGLKERQKWLARSEDDVAKELEGVLADSFKLRMVSDVPVGMFLSGGIDSSIVTALLQKESSRPLRTFTIGFHEKNYDEAPWAKKVAEHLGTEHVELYCTPKEAFDIIPKLPDLYDEPFGDSSGIPTFLLSQLTQKHVKVSLSADGGDELFCGYSRYWMIPRMARRIKGVPLWMRRLAAGSLNMINPDIASGLYENLSGILPKVSNLRDKYIKFRKVLGSDDPIGQYFQMFSVFKNSDLGGLNLPEAYSPRYLMNEHSELDGATRLMLADFNIYLPEDLLTKVDRTTMAVALEGREPFLDHKLVEYAARLPHEFKYKNGVSKYILKKILYKYVPRQLLERPKQGFGMPVFQWFKKEMKNFYIQYLNEGRIRKEGILNAGAVSALLKTYFAGKDTDPYKLWHLFCFQMWKGRWM